MKLHYEVSPRVFYGLLTLIHILGWGNGNIRLLNAVNDNIQLIAEKTIWR